MISEAKPAMTKHLLIIDEGTTSTRAMLFSVDGKCLGSAQRPLTQYYPAPGLVEHDAAEIWALTLACAQDMVLHAGGADKIAGIGITNQRETIVFWNKRTGEPLAPAIVWQDRRTADICTLLKAHGHEPILQAKTGLLLDPYFSASKIGWALAHWPQLKAAGDHLAVGTIESYLVFRLTGGLHVTDATNASRTALMHLQQHDWDADLCDMFGVPPSILPRIVDCAGAIGTTLPAFFGKALTISGMAGDQQAATIGQGCLAPGQSKATFGTGAFVLTQMGTTAPISQNRLLTTIAWQLNGARHYALEGSVFVAGSLIQWLRDDLGLIQHATEAEALTRTVPDNGNVYLVPALSGLGAPYWQPQARGIISGLNFSTKKAHIVRAALEAMAYQTHDLKMAFAADGADWAALKIDGGMSGNDWMAQDLADMLNITIERPALTETTALGAAMLAALGCGFYPSLDAAMVMRRDVQYFSPALKLQDRQNRLHGWTAAMQLVLSSSAGHPQYQPAP
jgi:glycerol kinase